MTQSIKTVDLPNGVKLPYVEQGSATGVPVILVHAIADSWRSFELVLRHLPGSIHAFALTQRGHGDATRPADGYRPEDFAADLLAFMNVLNVPAAVIVAGSSGGFTARQFAIRYPERTLGLVFLGSPAELRDKPAVLEIWDSTLSKLSDPIDSGFVRAFAEGTIVQSVPKAFVETMIQENLKVPARVWTATVKGLLDDDSFQALGRIDEPTLIIWGDKDSILPRADQDRLHAAIKGSRLMVFSGAGHALYWEEPERVAAEIAKFVTGVPKSS